jgi:ATP-dependent Clp protease ATP-binding subunit ClpB
LQRAQIRAIAEIQIESLRARLAEQDLKLRLSIAALDRLGEMGFDPVYGARPLKRAIQTVLETPLAQAILEGRFAAGIEILVDLDDFGAYTFNKITANAA